MSKGPVVFRPPLSSLQDFLSERKSNSELKSTRAARAKHAACSCHRAPEAGRPQEARVVRVVAVAHQRVCKPGVIHVRDAQNIGDIEQVEHFNGWFELCTFSQTERPWKREGRTNRICR